MKCYLGLGANLGDREKNLRLAIDRIKKIVGVKLLQVSSFYETAAWGLVNQPDFINAAIKISTTLDPLELLNKLQEIENNLGRVRQEHWGARTIDIDILLIDDLKIDSDRLTVPHPYLFERDFVLIPLKEIFPSLEIQLHGERIKKFSGSPRDFNLKAVACVDKNFGIGYKGEVLFNIPEDRKFFRELTVNHTIIYGRKTLKTFPNGQPLDSRKNILFSRSLEKIPNAEIVRNVENLWQVLDRNEENFVIGGEEIFNELVPYTSEIYLTVVDDEVKADRFFPKIAEDFRLAEIINVNDRIKIERWKSF